MTRAERREAYERVLGIVRHNTGGKQADAIDKAHILVIVSHSGADVDQGRTAIRAALENGDLVRTESGYRVSKSQ